jgi:hypothetical protein
MIPGLCNIRLCYSIRSPWLFCVGPWWSVLQLIANGKCLNFYYLFIPILGKPCNKCICIAFTDFLLFYGAIGTVNINCGYSKKATSQSVTSLIFCEKALCSPSPVLSPFLIHSKASWFSCFDCHQTKKAGGNLALKRDWFNLTYLLNLYPYVISTYQASFAVEKWYYLSVSQFNDLNTGSW